MTPLMIKPMKNRIKSKALMFAAAALVLPAIVQGQVALTDIGFGPTPGDNDISQFSQAGIANPPGLNYYWNNDPVISGFPGQTFTTLNSEQGYVLTSLAVLTGGGGGGNGASVTESQPFTLSIYQLSGTGLTNATRIATFTATNALAVEGDWLQWTGLGVPLLPNTLYAYGFGVSPGGPSDWEFLSTASGLPYAGGQVCEIIADGGTVTYSSSPNTFDATFDIGLSLPGAPIADPPLESPSRANLGVPAGTSVTLAASAGGVTPMSYQWQTDGGSGGVLTNIPGATDPNLVVNTTHFATGAYQYGYVATNVLGISTSPVTTITIATVLVDLGASAPTPGPLDISQLLNSSQQNDYLNYYSNNGAPDNQWPGQTFTTGTNPLGYALNSLAWKSAGNGKYFSDNHLYDLYIYSLSTDGTTATKIASYQASVSGVENDWLQWQGLNVPLAPNTKYAYAFGLNDPNSGWEQIADQAGNPYAGGKLCLIPAGGGAITYGASGNSDATFSLGLSVSQVPSAILPTYSPNVNPIYAGTPITLTESPVGQPPFSYQWLTDNGTGGALAPISGATGPNLALATAVGNYNYAVIVSTASGSSTSAVVTLNIIAASAPQMVTDLVPVPVNIGYVGQTLTYSASFAGTLPMSYQWMVDTGSGPTTISVASNPSAISNTLVLANLQLTNAGIYSVMANNSVGGPVSSSSSTLMVLADPAPPAPGTYGALILSNNPAAFWPLNETNDPSSGVVPAYDASGHGVYGVYAPNSENGFNGILGPQAPAYAGFPTNNPALGTLTGTLNSYVAVSAGSRMASNVTYAMWINPSGPVQNWAGLFMDRSSGGTGFGFGGARDGTGMSELGYTWNGNTTWNYDSHLFPPAHQWSFVALVIQPTQAAIYLITSGGVQAATNAIAHDTEPIGAAWRIGDDADGSIGGNVAIRTFPGAIADASVFLSALSGSQLAAIYQAGITAPSVTPVTLRVTPGVAGSMTLYWSQGTLLEATNVAGPWNSTTATSPYTVGTTNASTFFRVLVQP
jgi:hypothetical protein